MSEIDARSRSIQETLSKTKYEIDYYQREYRWESKNIRELIEDLTQKFLRNYHENHEPSQVESYENYFLGSIVISNKSGKKFIIDGQQRLTSISLLLIYIHNRQKESNERKVNIDELIFSEKFGVKSFNIDVEERVKPIEALFNQTYFDFDNAQSESVRNIGARYEDIELLFPEEITDKILPFFIDWLVHKVVFVHIEATSADDAYTIFETMNDRGLNLNPSDMLKGYLLANIKDDNTKKKANDLWKMYMLQLSAYHKDEELDFFKHWLRSQYAITIREGSRGSENKDFEKIATTFHKWVRENKEHLGLLSSKNYEDFILKEFDFYVKQYLTILEACKTYTPGLENIYYNSHNNFTHQFNLLLAPLKVTDSQSVVNKKMNLVAYYIDMFIVSRFIGFSTLNYSAISYTMYNLTKEIRSKELDELKDILKTKAAELNEMGLVGSFYLHQQNKKYVHYLLARLTHHIEKESGMDSKFETYVTKESRNPFQVEHIWANKYNRYAHEFNTEAEFQDYRNYLGGLLLLPKSINQSYGDSEYAVKLQQYFGQNLLAKSLHTNCYSNHPGFISYFNSTGLPFKPCVEFWSSDLDDRQELYRMIAEQIWNVDTINSF